VGVREGVGVRCKRGGSRVARRMVTVSLEATVHRSTVRIKTQLDQFFWFCLVIPLGLYLDICIFNVMFE
jgi:hypothetical protein